MRLKGGEVLCVWSVLTILGCNENPGAKGTSPPADAGVQVGDVAEDQPGTDDVQPPASLFQMIDDMDHTNNAFPDPPSPTSAFFWGSSTSVHIGNWFVSSLGGIDGDAHIDAIIPSRGESKKACHMSGSMLERGADLWAQLDHPIGRPVDLGAYAGIAFWARLNSPSSKLVIAIDDRIGGGFFTAQASRAPLPAQTIAVADQWEHVVLLFDDFGLDPSGVVSIDFVVGDGGESFDLWIDDLALLCRGFCAGSVR